MILTSILRNNGVNSNVHNRSYKIVFFLAFSSFGEVFFKLISSVSEKLNLANQIGNQANLPDWSNGN
jgi:hypothetical protein